MGKEAAPRFVLRFCCLLLAPRFCSFPVVFGFDPSPRTHCYFQQLTNHLACKLVMLNDFFVCDKAVWTYCADSLWNPQEVAAGPDGQIANCR